MAYRIPGYDHWFYKGPKKGEPRGAIYDLTGERFERLKVIEFAYVKNHQAYWKCLCECGTEKIISAHSLRTGQTVSCGCKKNDDFLTFNTTRDGLTIREHRLYNIFNGIWHRCYNPKTTGYENYGGRGIYMASEWYDPDDETHLAKFTDFVEWAYANGYSDPDPDAPRSKGLTIDRIDNDGPYAPWNCRWQYPVDQMNNRSVNMYIYDGEEWLTFSRFARKYGIGNRGHVRDKLKIGWNVHEIIYAAKHPEVALSSSSNIKRDPTKRDGDGFIRIIPHTPGACIITADEYHQLMKENREG